MDHGLRLKSLHTEYTVVPHLSFAAEVAQSQSLAEAQKLDAFTCQFIPVFLQEALGCPKNREGRLIQHTIFFTINPLSLLTYVAQFYGPWADRGSKACTYRIYSCTTKYASFFCSWSGSVTVISWDSKAWRIHLPVHPSVSSGSSGLP